MQQVLPQYRLPFFEQLRDDLAVDAIRLRLLHGHSAKGAGDKGDERGLDWAEPIANRELKLPGGHSIDWQPFVQATRGSDLVVLEHAGRHVGTWPLIAGRGRR